MGYYSIHNNIVNITFFRDISTQVLNIHPKDSSVFLKSNKYPFQKGFNVTDLSPTIITLVTIGNGRAQKQFNVLNKKSIENYRKLYKPIYLSYELQLTPSFVQFFSLHSLWLDQGNYWRFGIVPYSSPKIRCQARYPSMVLCLGNASKRFLQLKSSFCLHILAETKRKMNVLSLNA